MKRILIILLGGCMAVGMISLLAGCGASSGEYTVVYGGYQYHGPDLWDYYPPPYYHRPGYRPDRPDRPNRPIKPIRPEKPIPKPPPNFGRPPGGPSIQPVPKPTPKPMPRPTPRARPAPRGRRR
ncbi:MAG TPA: hypothetical protein ENG51_09035 [Deltaproteobacteria bacterium]|nr:hypothetical protein [Deltaproteobacteria bacterium]HEC31665.1 hypothetical protein [Deltaproteobacteria bacterium]